MRIKGFEKLKYLSSFELIKREGTHTVCRFSFRAVIDDALPLLQKEGAAVTVERDDGSTLFYGIIRSVAVEENYHGAILSAEAMSYSVLADETPFTRIFQKSTQTLNDILTKLEWSKSKCELNLGEAKDKKPAGLRLADEETNAVIQDDETDFRFLRRLTAAEKFRLWIIDSHSGRTEIKTAKFLTEKTVKSKYIISLTRKRENKETHIYLRLSAKFELDTGEKIKIENIPGNFIVVSKIMKKEREIFNFDYELIEENKPLQFDEEETPSRIFNAEVLNNKDLKKLGRIQVRFIDNDVIDMGKPPESIWIPYRTPYGGKVGKGGVVFLPDIGDIVEVLLIGRKLWAADSFRKGELLEECSNPNEKYIGNNFKQRIFWKEKSLELASFKNKIVMDEKKIEFAIGESKTRFFMDKDRMVFETEGNIVELSKDGVKMKTNKDIAAEGNANIHIKSGQNLRFESSNESSLNTGGKTIIKSGGKVLIDGSEVDIG